MKIKKFTTILLLAPSMALQAWIAPAPGHFALNGEILWLHASLEDTYFAVQGSTAGGNAFVDGTRYHKNFNFHPAYRLEGIYSFCNGCNDLHFRGTYFHNDVTRTISTGPIPTNLFYTTQNPGYIDSLMGGFGFADNASSKANVRYYALDAFFGQTVYSHLPFHLSLQSGLQYVNLKVDEQYFYSALGTITSLTENHANMWALGPELAFDFQYLFPSWTSCLGGQFSVTANMKASLLATRNHTSFSSAVNIDGASFFDFENNPNWRVITAMEYQFGLNYFRNCSCFDYSLTIGYDFINYQKALSRTRIFGTFNGPVAPSFDEYGDFGLHGPFLALGVSY